MTNPVPIEPNELELWTVRDVARALRVSRTTVFSLDLPRVRLGSSGKIVRFRPEDVRAYIEARHPSLRAAS